MIEVATLLEGIIPSEANLMLTLIFFTSIIVIYSVFVFYFYRFLGKKNIIELNLNQYNQYQSPALIKMFLTKLPSEVALLVR